MSVWAGFANQLPKALENRRKSRLEMLDAFNEFKAANPYATAAEFQEFIDNASGEVTTFAAVCQEGSSTR